MFRRAPNPEELRQKRLAYLSKPESSRAESPESAVNAAEASASIAAADDQVVPNGMSGPSQITMNFSVNIS